MADIHATPLPQFANQSRPVLDQAVARSTNYSAAAPAAPGASSEMDSLLSGLSSFNRSLSGYTQQAQSDQEILNVAAREENTRRAQDQAAADAANKDRWSNIEEAVNGPLPDSVPLAFGDVYRKAFGSLLVDNAANKARGDLATAYAEARKAPDFDPAAFKAEWKQNFLGGLQNPALVGQMGKKWSELEMNIDAATEKDRVGKQTEKEDSLLFSYAENNFSANMSATDLGKSFNGLRDQARSFGRTPKEAAGILFGRVMALSNQKEGDPALFDVFNQVDPDTGQTLLALNPELAPHLATARTQAKALQERGLEEKSQSENVPIMAALDAEREQDPSSITIEKLLAHRSTHGLFPTMESLMHYYRGAQKEADAKGFNAEVAQSWTSGTMGKYPDKVQKDEMERQLGPWAVKSWQDAIVNKNIDAAAQVIGRVMQEQGRAGVKMPMESIKNLLNTAITTPPDKVNGPSASFLAAAAVYQKFSGADEFRDTYLTEKSAKLMEAYQFEMGESGDPKVAYTKAYEATSAAAIEAAKETVKDPKFKSKLKGVLDEVQGVGFFKSWFGIGQGVHNAPVVQYAAKQATEQFLMQNPGKTTEQALAFAEKWTKDNFAKDPVTGEAVQVPKGLNDGNMVNALEMSTKALLEANPGYTGVQYRKNGDNGAFFAVLTDGVAQKPVGAINAQDIKSRYMETLNFTPADLLNLGKLRRQAAAGALDANFVGEQRALIAKARRLEEPNFWQRAVSNRGYWLDDIEAVQMATLSKSLSMMPTLDLGPPNGETLQFNPKLGNRVDNKLTADMALRQFNASKPKGLFPMVAPHVGMAASLITMAEGVMPKAYADPNPEAGNNIGMGYNLKANAKTAVADLKRAGVPAEKVQDVIDGKAQLAPAQAERLLMSVSMPRYEKTAQEAADATAPDLWYHMTPQQKAVMVDIAWQTGDPAQFKKAWSSLASGDMAKFTEETRVFYKTADGTKEDTRRGNLRRAMLAGEGRWLAEVNKYGSYTNNTLAATGAAAP